MAQARNSSGVAIATFASSPSAAIAAAPRRTASSAASRGEGESDRAAASRASPRAFRSAEITSQRAWKREGFARANSSTEPTRARLSAGVPVTLVGFAGGSVLLTPVVLAVGLHVPADPVAIAVLLYLGLVPSALAYMLFFSGIRSVPGPVASIVTLLEPLTATVLATGLLGERLAPAALAGGLLVLAAVVVLYLRRMGDSNSRGVAPNPLSKRAP